jgi:hypothetical protein
MSPYKSRPIRGFNGQVSRYLTRKDWHHEQDGYFLSWYRKKPWREVANRQVRRFKGEMQNNSGYKKIFDVQWKAV